MKIVKLQKGYYKYADTDISKLNKIDETESVTINLTAYISCKLEQFAVQEQKPVRNILRQILIDEGVLDLVDVEFSNTMKGSSKFFGVNCDELKDIAATKLYRVPLSEYAKAKVLNRMIEEGFDLSFFIKRALVIKANKKNYQIIHVSDIDN